MYDVAIIGCGVIGASIAMELSKYQLKTIILEKENDICDGTTKANSAIIHAGYDPLSNTLMAKLNVEGCNMAPKLCKELDVPYRQIGSLVLAFNEKEKETLNELMQRGIANGIPKLKLLDRFEVLHMEPKVSKNVVAALYAPMAGIVDPWELGIAMAEVAVKNGTQLLRRNEVTNIEKLHNGWRLKTTETEIESRFVLNAAGVSCEAIHNMAAEPSFKISPCKGEYYLLDKSEAKCVEHIIFQCPNEHGKGVLVAPTVHGNLIVGPTAENINNTYDTSVTADGLELVKQSARKSVPCINFRNNIRNFAGIRANSSVRDFIIEESAPQFIDIAGMRSPGLASSPAVGPYVAEILKQAGLGLKEKEEWDGKRKVIRFKDLSPNKKKKLIREQPAYGRVICRCETITEGEIIAAIHSIIPPCSIDGIKRRTGAGMGRCQGGFCGPKILEIIARETDKDPLEILNDKDGSYILTGKTKDGGALHEDV